MTLRLTSVFLVLLAFARAAENPPVPPLKLANGFAVERIYTVPRESQGSWIALAADRQGRLYASDQYGPLYRVTVPRSPSEPAVATKLPLTIGGVHGLTWIGADLYAVVGQKSVAPTGLYRLRDTDRDGELDEVTLLRALEGDGEHAPHAVVPSPDARSLYVIAGNATRRPELTRSRVPPLWGEDALLPPLPAVVGSETRGYLGGGWVCRTDLDGRDWELVASGMRNAYALACDERGELFTFDSDTEFEINLPWYRPTRVLHLVSGADFGWRRGLHKIPATAPDAWPALLPLGLGSPTAVLFPREARIPERYRRALWVADWSYGKLYAVHLRERGATFAAEAELVLSGTPLPITAVCVNPVDGALYFATGGRRTQSALYRLAWTGEIPANEATRAKATPLSPAVAERLALEAFHGRVDPAAIAAAWPALGSDDDAVRRAARTAIESQPVLLWRERALTEQASRPALAALLALARVDARGSQSAILAALRPHVARNQPDALQTEALRVLTLTLARGSELPAETQNQWGRLLEKTFPANSPKGKNASLIELLVTLESPHATRRGFVALRRAASREAQIDLARILRARPAAWSTEQRAEYFTWLAGTASWRGGSSFALLLKNLRAEALALALPAERPALEAALVDSKAPVGTLPTQRAVVRAWTVDELVSAAGKDPGPRDPARGKRMFAASGCYACHTFAGEGGALGPDLTNVASRLSLRDLLEAIIDPSREISDQYGTVRIILQNGTTRSGRIVNYTEQGLQLAENLLDPSNTVRLSEKEVVAIEPSKVSLMPTGLLDRLEAVEILDLLAFLRREPSAP